MFFNQSPSIGSSFSTGGTGFSFNTQPSSNSGFNPSATLTPNSASALSSLYPNTNPTTTIQPTISNETAFGDLPDSFKQELTKLQEFIQEQKNLHETISQRSKTEITRVRETTSSVLEKVTTLSTMLDADLQSIQSFKREVSNALRNAENAARTMERMKSPILLNQMNFSAPSSYFKDLVSVFEKRMQIYRQNIEEIEKLVATESYHGYSPQMLQQVMRNQHEFFIYLAAQLASLHDSVNDLKQEYLNYRQKYFGERADPFAVVEKKKKVVFDLQPPKPPQPSQPATPQQNFSNSFFPTNNTSTTTPFSSSFASNTPTFTPAPSPAPNLFGTPSTPSTPATSTNLFGNTPSNTTSASVFGTPTSTPNTGSTFAFAPSSTPTPTLFGSTTTAPTTTTTTTTTATFTPSENPNTKRGKGKGKR